MNPDLELQLRFRSRAEHLKTVRLAVATAARLAGCSTKRAEEMVIAVNEACMNVIQHGYAHDPEGEIILEILNNGDSLEFRLRDFAACADPDKVCPRALDDLRPGGLGVHFIREIMDEFTVAAGPGNKGNLWRMTKKIQPKKKS